MTQITEDRASVAAPAATAATPTEEPALPAVRLKKYPINVLVRDQLAAADQKVASAVLERDTILRMIMAGHNVTNDFKVAGMSKNEAGQSFLEVFLAGQEPSVAVKRVAAQQAARKGKKHK